jgi:hypothetical protein
MTEIKWISVNPAKVFAFEALGHTVESTVVIGDSVPN